MNSKAVIGLCALASVGLVATFLVRRGGQAEGVTSEGNEATDTSNATRHSQDALAPSRLETRSAPPPPPPPPPKKTSTEPIDNESATAELDSAKVQPDAHSEKVKLEAGNIQKPAQGNPPTQGKKELPVVKVEDLTKVALPSPFDAVVGADTIAQEPETLRSASGQFEGEVKLLSGAEPLGLELMIQPEVVDGKLEGNSSLRLHNRDGSNVSSVTHQGMLSFLKKGNRGKGEVVFTDLGPISKNVSQELVLHVFQLFFDGGPEVVGNYYRRKKEGLQRAGSIVLHRTESEKR